MGESQPTLHGTTDARLEPVRSAFLDGFEQGRDVGAAVAVTIDDALVVDLWAGYRNRKHTLPWEKDTLCCMFSVTKAITAVCVLQAVAEGHIELDTPVAACWPEFAANEKQNITPRHLLSHRAGLIGFHEPVTRDVYYDWTSVTSALAAEKPWWTPGEKHGYHARTYGFLLGELLRRATGLSVGQWFQRRIALPLELDFKVGLPDHDLMRCADMLPARIRAGEQKNWSSAVQIMMKAFNDTTTPTGAAFQNPSLGPGYMNSSQFRKAELPAVNGHGTARSVALLFSHLSSLLPAEIIAEATTTHSMGPDAVLISLTHFGLGFMLHHDQSPIGIRDGTFGHAGAGGSMAFYDPGARLGFCFVMNQMQEGVITGGESAMHIAHSVYECL
ncbi:MAG: serine hydrolase [Gammaproteobacteria bacterium]|nr:serine hydrolase [Gammaproteobacteria bacterium]